MVAIFKKLYWLRSHACFGLVWTHATKMPWGYYLQRCKLIHQSLELFTKATLSVACNCMLFPCCVNKCVRWVSRWQWPLCRGVPIVSQHNGCPLRLVGWPLAVGWYYSFPCRQVHIWLNYVWLATGQPRLPENWIASVSVWIKCRYDCLYW